MTITLREIYDEKFYALHKSCMEMAIKEVREMRQLYPEIPIENYDISALTFQHYRMFLDKEPYMRTIKENKEKGV